MLPLGCFPLWGREGVTIAKFENKMASMEGFNSTRISRNNDEKKMR
jgi:hypothetical protein